MSQNMERGARIVIEEWMRVKRWDKLLIVTTQEHLEELRVLREYASKHARSVNSLVQCRRYFMITLAMRRLFFVSMVMKSYSSMDRPSLVERGRDRNFLCFWIARLAAFVVTSE